MNQKGGGGIRCGPAGGVENTSALALGIPRPGIFSRLAFLLPPRWWVSHPPLIPFPNPRTRLPQICDPYPPPPRASSSAPVEGTPASSRRRRRRFVSRVPTTL
ncbi:hypothetical protein PVAP13_7NG216834 [Panicum virgatum]|uniref:Uncharacterized protein n=1 Tax=Panicum virgatum TaxID=38727 RepID=A0A8T0Q1H9_PANVG|nr:hypothetical protein PVAP13_7NG216834 [Panicum virgatum]